MKIKIDKEWLQNAVCPLMYSIKKDDDITKTIIIEDIHVGKILENNEDHWIIDTFPEINMEDIDMLTSGYGIDITIL